MRLKLNLTTWIFIGMILGIIGGMIGHNYLDADAQKQWVSNVSIGSDIFLHLIKMVISPLVFCLLASGIAKTGNLSAIGRIGGRAMLWFICASFVSLLIGLLLMNIFNIGQYMSPAKTTAEVVAISAEGQISLRDFILHIFPDSIVKAMSNNEVLQVVVFALFFGVAAAALGDKVKTLVHILDEIGKVLLQMMVYVMYISPIASFAALFNVITLRGISALKSYLFLILLVFLGLFILWLIIIAVAYIFLKGRIFELLKHCRTPFFLAFSTTSSESVYPLIIDRLKKFGCKEKIIDFVLPLGYALNLDGSMMYTSVATLFIAQVYGIHLPVGTQITMLFFLMVTSKGIAAVPRVAMVVIAGALAAFNIPEAGLALLVGIDAILDMGRTITNVMGNTVATAVISKLEGELSVGVSQEKNTSV